MNPEIAESGINAPLLRVAISVLRSGLIPQATGKLCRLNEDGTVKGMCCLGVLTHVAIAFGGLKITEDIAWDGQTRIYRSNSAEEGFLLPEVMALYGFTSRDVILQHDSGEGLMESRSASGLNDALVPHPVIADAFERTFLPQDVKA
jgi:hypothetical protein